MAAPMGGLPAADGGFDFAEEMVGAWCAACDSGGLPDGHAFAVGIVPGRPRPINEAAASPKCPEPGAWAAEAEANGRKPS